MKVVKIPTNPEGITRSSKDYWNNLWNKVRGGWAPPRGREQARRKGCRFVLMPNGRKVRLIPLWRIGVKRYSSTNIIFSPQARAYLRSNVWGQEGDSAWVAAENKVSMELEMLIERVRKVVG